MRRFRNAGHVAIAMITTLLFPPLHGYLRAAVNIETVNVGNAGNDADTVPLGSHRGVDYEYAIGRYEVTAGQYAQFLNAVGRVDTYGLYNPEMANTAYGSGISRADSGTPGDPYTYTPDSSFVNRPVNFVNWGDATRFANWWLRRGRTLPCSGGGPRVANPESPTWHNRNRRMR